MQKKYDINSLEYDPGKRPLIWSYHVHQQDDIRRAYIVQAWLLQHIMLEYPSNEKIHHFFPCFMV